MQIFDGNRMSNTKVGSVTDNVECCLENGACTAATHARPPDQETLFVMALCSG